MRYYILLPDDTEKDCLTETNLLGEMSFNTFYASSGFLALNKIVSRKDEDGSQLIEQVTIKSDAGETFTIDEFLDIISKARILVN